MSYRALFDGMLARLKRRRWGVSLKQTDGTHVDTGVQAFADELAIALGAETPIVLNQPIKIRRNYIGPVFVVLDDDADAINYLADDGSQSSSADPLSKAVQVSDTAWLIDAASAIRT